MVCVSPSPLFWATSPPARTEADILEDFPDLEPEDIPAALEYAAAAVQEGGLPLTRQA